MGELSQKEAYRVMLMDYPDVLSFEQMCEALRVSPKTGYKILKNGKTTCLKVGRAYRIPKPHILTYLLIKKHADEKLKEGRSPDAVAGRAKESVEWADKPVVCAKTLYNYVDKGLTAARNIDPALKVRRRHKLRPVRRHKILPGESIEKRPSEVEEREEFGHWEIGSVIGKQSDKTAVMTLVERKTRSRIAVKLDGRDSAATDSAITAIYNSFGMNAERIIRSITGDNGHEFAGLKAAVKCAVYFRHPYSSWEKGTNERHNGLLRRFVKKGRSIDDMPPELIETAAARNNNLPGKILGYKTPAEAFARELRKLTEPA